MSFLYKKRFELEEEALKKNKIWYPTSHGLPSTFSQHNFLLFIIFPSEKKIMKLFGKISEKETKTGSQKKCIVNACFSQLS
jgi:hypothetical protein